MNLGQFPSVILNRMHWLDSTLTQREPYWHKQLIWALDDNVNMAKAVSDFAQQVLLLSCPCTHCPHGIHMACTQHTTDWGNWGLPD